MNEPDTRAELIEYCRQKDRVCPMPMKWNDLYQLLLDTRRVGDGWEPSLPLILGAWHYSSNVEKMLRLEEHIAWAEEHASLVRISEFLRGLDETGWHHLND